LDNRQENLGQVSSFQASQPKEAAHGEEEQAAHDDLAKHPLRQMLDKGLMVTVNSDDPAYFGGYVNQNYREVADALGLNRDEIVTIARNGIQASLMTPSEKNEAFAEINRILATIA
jgi:adenosine deaminase